MFKLICKRPSMNQNHKPITFADSIPTREKAEALQVVLVNQGYHSFKIKEYTPPSVKTGTAKSNAIRNFLSNK